MASSVMPQPSTGASGNGATTTDALGVRPAEATPLRGPRSRLLARLTSLTSIATVAAAGMIVVGVLALVGGSYDRQVVHDQLAPQKIFFPPAGSAALLPGVRQYAGQQLLTGAQAKAYANGFIGVHVTKIAAGQTYAQVSAKSLADPKNATLAAQKAALSRARPCGACARRVGLVGDRHARDAPDPPGAEAGPPRGTGKSTTAGVGTRMDDGQSRTGGTGGGTWTDEHVGRFSEGEEALPNSPEKDQVGRFSEGERPPRLAARRRRNSRPGHRRNRR